MCFLHANRFLHVGLHFFSRYLDPRGWMVVFYVINLARVSRSYQDSAATKVDHLILASAHVQLTAS